ncbi:MAG: hypothetical protein IKE28_11800 [Solobacterium sp.]|nr:hypothetical protein [Solobacterium sp.]
MNRKEAIRILEDFKVQDDWSQVYMPELHDAIDCATGALKELEYTIPIDYHERKAQEYKQALEQNYFAEITSD